MDTKSTGAGIYAGPLISVITPAFNSAGYIHKTIESVQAQTCEDWEMITVDDCSSDNTCEVVEYKSKTDGRVKLIKLDRNSGQANARNVALRHARGRYIAFLDSDDLWLPEKLERQLEFMRSRGAAFSFSQYRQMSQDGDKDGRLIEVPPSLDYGGLLANTGIIGCLTVMLDREKTGPFEFRMVKREDLVLWLHLLKRGFTAYGMQEDLARYRIVNNSHSRDKLRAAYWTWKVYRRVEKLGLFFACRCFARYAWNAYHRNKGMAITSPIELFFKVEPGKSRRGY